MSKNEETIVIDLEYFIEYAIELANNVEGDIIKGNQISDETVLALSRFIQVSEPVLAQMAGAMNKKQGPLQ